MSLLQKDKIGKVSLIIQSRPAKNEDYLDSSEETLLRVFSSERPEKRVEEILLNNPVWPLLYHLSPARENLLNWYSFPKNASLLEVGAGCGALTGLFCRSLKKVVALELVEKRARITALRHKNMDNLEAVVGNIEDFECKEKFDFVTSIGVLEYAGLYIKDKDPYLKFLKVLNSFLKPKGILILAIENKLGLKYWAGCREDHTARGFDSIQNYPDKSGVKTFGRVELKGLLKKSGFEKQFWYYPLPDYKLPVEVYSQEFLPGDKSYFANGLFPTVDRARKREFFFSEFLVIHALIENNLFEDFTNSFLIFAEAK